MQARHAAALDPRVAGGEVLSSKLDLVVWLERDDEDLFHSAHLAYVVDMWVVRWVCDCPPLTVHPRVWGRGRGKV